MNTYICHYGVGHLQGGNSGRYKWGTGEKWAKKASSEFDQMLQGALDIANGMKVMEYLKENYIK